MNWNLFFDVIAIVVFIVSCLSLITAIRWWTWNRAYIMDVLTIILSIAYIIASRG